MLSVWQIHTNCQEELSFFIKTRGCTLPLFSIPPNMFKECSGKWLAVNSIKRRLSSLKGHKNTFACVLCDWCHKGAVQYQSFFYNRIDETYCTPTAIFRTKWPIFQKSFFLFLLLQFWNLDHHLPNPILLLHVRGGVHEALERPYMHAIHTGHKRQYLIGGDSHIVGVAHDTTAHIFSGAATSQQRSCFNYSKRAYRATRFYMAQKYTMVSNCVLHVWT